MKKFLFLILFACLPIWANPISSDCSFKGKKLYGRVRIVEANEDIRVRVVTANEEFRVFLNPITWQDRCGEWHYVTANENLKIRFVEANEDFRIRFVGANPGL
jgi:hypothetical protein